jgi:uncharacterized protein (DUF1810 family)
MSELREDLFIGAQAAMWPSARAELEKGRKRGHWMWFVFPQLAGLGESENAKLFGLTPAAAREYAVHPVLAPRLLVAVLHVCAIKSVARAFGGVDTMKLHSSLTLFEQVTPNPGDRLFRAALDAHFDGRYCTRTIMALQPGSVVV